MARRGAALIYVLLLLAVTALWGWTFVVVKDAISAYPPLPFLWIRFGLALLAVGVFLRQPPDGKTLRAGLAIGLVLAASYLLQTLGLQTTTPGNAGLITGVFVVFTPLIGFFFGDLPARRTVLAAALALIGVVLLTGGPAGFGIGDALVLGCAVAFALHIVLLSRWAPDRPATPLAAAQMLACALVFTPAGLAGLRPPSGMVWVAIVITGLFASGLAFFLQTWAQARLDATRAALVLSTEPAWALFFAVLLAGQRLGLLQALGAALVLTAILGHELASLKFRVPRWH